MPLGSILWSPLASPWPSLQGHTLECGAISYIGSPKTKSLRRILEGYGETPPHPTAMSKRDLWGTVGEGKCYVFLKYQRSESFEAMWARNPKEAECEAWGTSWPGCWQGAMTHASAQCPVPLAAPMPSPCRRWTRWPRRPPRRRTPPPSTHVPGCLGASPPEGCWPGEPVRAAPAPAAGPGTLQGTGTAVLAFKGARARPGLGYSPPKGLQRLPSWPPPPPSDKKEASSRPLTTPALVPVELAQA